MSKYLKKVINFNSFLVFEKASTYTAISILEKTNREDFNYYTFIDEEMKFLKKIKNEDFARNSLAFKEKDGKTIEDLYNVQYALTTLADKVFISKDIKEIDGFYLFNNYKIEKDIIKPIIKGSTLEELYIIFPYKKDDGRIVPYKEEELKSKYPLAYKYFLDKKDLLLNRSIEKNKNWYEYGRSQGLQNILNKKIAISHIVKDKISYKEVDEDTLVYSGLFATLKDNKKDFKELEDKLNSDEFLKHIKYAGKDLRGGYKSIKAAHIKSIKIN